MKLCSKCGVRPRYVLPGSGRVDSWCCECHAAASRAWRAANPDKVAATNRAWYVANPERTAIRVSKWRTANPERVVEHSRRSVLKRRAAHPESIAEDISRLQQWSIANPERAAAASRAWRTANPEKTAAAVHKRRERKVGAKITIHQISDICCVPTCGKPLLPNLKFPDPMSTTIGHEPPLSRLGELGVTTVTERPEHWICNQHKHNKLDSELVEESA